MYVSWVHDNAERNNAGLLPPTLTVSNDTTLHHHIIMISCVLSTSAEGNTPRGVPHRVQGNVDAAETPSDGLMPQSHLAPFTSLHGAAHHMCTFMVAEPLLRPPSLDSRSRTFGLGLVVFLLGIVLGSTGSQAGPDQCTANRGGLPDQHQSRSAS